MLPKQSKSYFIPFVLSLLLLASCNFNLRKHGSNTNKAIAVESIKPGDRIVGKVVKVHDGDTYDLLIQDSTTIRIRMEGIDAPEGGMPFYRVAKHYLSKLSIHQEVTAQITQKDHYNRFIAHSYLNNGDELSREMLKAGLAWHYKQYNDDPELANMEREARRLKKGLWVDKNPKAPWEIRKIRRSGVSTKNLFNIKEGQE